MKGLFILPVAATLLALPAMAQPVEGKRVQKRVTVERNANGDIRRTAERRGVQRRVTDNGAAVRRGADRRVTTRRTTDNGVVVTRQVDRKRVVRHPDGEPTLRQKYHKFKRKLHARAKNAVENGARPKVVRHKVHKAKRKFIRRAKASQNN